MIISNPLFTQDVPATGVTKGHVRFVLNSPLPKDVALVGACANLAGSVLFERLQAQGSNLIIQLTQKPRFDVIARWENDGLALQWAPKTATPEELEDIRAKISAKVLPSYDPMPVAPTPVPEPMMPAPSPTDEPDEEEEEDYLVKQLHRIP